MSLLPAAVAATVLAATEEPAPLILPNWAFVVIAFTVFLTLALVSWSFRDVANRHSDKTSGAAQHGTGSHGTGSHGTAQHGTGSHGTGSHGAGH